jgi:hypothetical protein
MIEGLSSWQLGHAAAYYAYRTLRDGPPTQGDAGHQRETLIGKAVAEGALYTSPRQGYF